MAQDDGLKCPQCQSVKINKNGRKNGKQRFLCKNCRRQFVESYIKQGYDEAFKTICLQAYRNGKSFREIERVYDVHHTTVISWVKQAEFDLSALSRSNLNKLAEDGSLQSDQNLLTRSNMAEIHKRVVLSALQSFTKLGYLSVDMAQIATAAGVSIDTLETLFVDKEALFSALIQYLLNEIRQALSNLATNDGSTDSGSASGSLTGDSDIVLPEVALRRVATTLLTAFSKDPVLTATIRLVVGESGRFPNLARRFVSDFEKPIIEQLSTYFRFHPDVQISDPTVATRIFVGSLIHHSLIQDVLQGEDILPLQSDRLVDALITASLSQPCSTRIPTIYPQ